MDARLFAIIDVNHSSMGTVFLNALTSYFSSTGIKCLVAFCGDSKVLRLNQVKRSSELELAASNLSNLVLASMLLHECSAKIILDSFVSQEFLRRLASIYDIIIFCVGGINGSSSIQAVLEIPSIVIVPVEGQRPIATISAMVEKSFAVECQFKPCAFVTELEDKYIAARLSSRWHLPFWGSVSEISMVATKLLDRASACSPQNGAAATPSHTDEKFETIIRETLTEIRKDKEFKNIDAKLKDKIANFVRRFLSTVDHEKIKGFDIDAIIARVINDAIGYGPIEALLGDPQVSEVMINGHDNIYMEKDGYVTKVSQKFESKGQLMTVIERMVATVGRRVDESSPTVDARLADGSRLNVVIPPISIDGATVTIRRFIRKIKTIEDLVRIGAITESVAKFLAACVRAKISMIVSGGTGTGKTTLLSALASAIADGERIITIEDAAELDISARHVVRLEARPPNIEGKGEITIRDLVRNALRMRPDRIVVGECRGVEAIDMLQAMNTGHEGSLTTIHANSPRDALARLETMVLMSGLELPINVLREQIARAIRLIIQVGRSSSGNRCVSEIVEVTGIEGNVICLQTLAKISEGISRTLESTRLIPTFAPSAAARGVEIPRL